MLGVGPVQVQQTDQYNRAEVYERTYDVLKPEVTKMKQLMAFCDKSVALVRSVLAEALSEPRRAAKAYPSEEYLLTLARMFNLFMVIDALKNMKTSLNNDFAMYKRYVCLSAHACSQSGGSQS
jgi:cytoplasmic FMR1 interacting protein